jgi:protein phosphatase 2C family protein 2/3
MADAEKQFIKASEEQGERSGSCAIVALLVEEKCYIANVGDSRAIMSSDGGKSITALSTDHKPQHPLEYARIVANGGSVYQ